MQKISQFISSILLLPVFSFAQVAQPTYCNGQARVVEGDPVYANGTRIQIRGDTLYPTGTRTVQLGEVVYPNGQRLQIGDEEYHLSGSRVLVGGDLYYPNGQRVQIGTDCFYQSGTKMNRCPAQVRFEDQAEGVIVKGVMDLKSRRVVDRTFEFDEPGLTTTWKVDSSGKIYDVQSRCDQSLL